MKAQRKLFELRETDDGLIFDIPDEFDEYTSLEKAMELAIDKEEWFTVKKIWFGLERFDGGREGEIWSDFNRLMHRAIDDILDEGDLYLLHHYRRPAAAFKDNTDEGVWVFHSFGDKNLSAQHFDRELKSNVDLFKAFLDIELTASLFDYIWDIWMGRIMVRQCAAEDCFELFAPYRSNHRFHSPLCQRRQFMRDKRKGT